MHTTEYTSSESSNGRIARVHLAHLHVFSFHRLNSFPSRPLSEDNVVAVDTVDSLRLVECKRCTVERALTTRACEALRMIRLAHRLYYLRVVVW